MKKIFTFLLTFIICLSSSIQAFALDSVKYTCASFEAAFKIGGADINDITWETDTNKKSTRRFFKSSVSLDEYVKNAFISHSSSVDISGYNMTASDFNLWYPAFVFINSDLPVYTSCSTTVSEGIVTSFVPRYIYADKEECDKKTKELESVVKSITDYADKGNDPLEKALFAFDKIALEYYYTPGDESDFTRKNRTAFGLMDDGHGVCQGYAIMYSLVLNKLGIENYLCYNGDPDINHIWNYVNLNGKWYHTDPTSAETTSESVINHTYFMVSDSFMTSLGNHGAKADWQKQKPFDYTLDCKDTSFEKNHLFNSFNVPFQRDAKSLYFSIDSPMNPALEITLRNHTLSTKGLILSEPYTHEDSTNIYLFTTCAYSSPLYVLGAVFDGNVYSGCTRLFAESLPGGVFIKLPVPQGFKGDSLKYMLLSEDHSTPLSFFSQMTIN